MRLLRARFDNFRLLRDLELEFGAASDRPLTVIRAANETGKTTLLNALQWALYGDGALPNKGVDFRLHPIDWHAPDGAQVPITVSVDFEVIRYNKVAGSLREVRHRFRIIRSAFEQVRGTQWQRSAASVKLFALTEHGASPVDAPDALINDELPPELREVFFTDGDRALSFIQSDVAASTKRERVQRAIRSLLGLGVIEEAMRHVKKAAGDINRHARQLGGNSELATVAGKLDGILEQAGELEDRLADAHSQFTAFDEKLSDVEGQIDEALRKGDREKLRRDLEATAKLIARLDERLVAANKEHSSLFRGQAVACDILAPVLRKAFAALDELHERGKIPNTTVPVLEERLSMGECICGESLGEDTPDGELRVQHIRLLIEGSRRADGLQEIVTDLYYGAKPLGDRDADSRWLALYTRVVEQRDGLQTLRDDEGRKLRALELQIDALPESDIQGLRELRRQYLEQRDRFNALGVRIETQLDGIARERGELVRKREQLLREQTKGARILSELEVSKDISDVLESAYRRITEEELTKVSNLMNSTFLEMIGADPEQGAIIKRAQISSDFDIVVTGPGGRILNPDRDLNGASRRALTLAFILALTRVSEVEAPNVIDTPLGMMSGFVKRAVLRKAILESSQLVLLLTHSEIAGCEEILDASASSVITLTNPAHYPTMLVNDPGQSDLRVMACSCNHREQCRLCERRVDAE